MLRFAFLLATSALASSNALAQRANENAVKAASDAFGTSVGNEKIGIYSSNDVRGFSPEAAGNVRIEGLSVTQFGGITNRIVSGSAIRVGLTAQSYPFPAPTGIVDYTLRSSGDDLVVSPIVYIGPSGNRAIDVDAQVPLRREQLSLAAGITLRSEELFIGERANLRQFGSVLRWRPNAAVEVKSFYGRMEFRDDLDIGSVFVSGSALPPKVKRRYFGLDWTTSEKRRQAYGGVSSVELSPTMTAKLGIFRWEDRTLLGLSELYRDVQPDGSAVRSVVATRDQLQSATSGEFRLSFTQPGERRVHKVHLITRGRFTRRAFGGADVIDTGRASIATRTPAPIPAFEFGAQTYDKVRQVTVGLGYQGLWRDVGEISLGVQRTDYRKVSDTPAGLRLKSSDDPWLYNGTLALNVSKGLVAYAGITRGLEESGVAPANAINRNSAPPAIRTDQKDAGVRYAFVPGLSLVAGLFEVRKPYFNLDESRVYRQLGSVRHRGVELSIAGEPVTGLSLVGGAVFLDADITGETVQSGSIGPKPVGTTALIMRANLDYRLPFHPALSVDLGINVQGSKIASAATFAELNGEQLKTRPLSVFDIGARYRLNLASVPVVIRGQVTNVFDTYRWNVSTNSSFKFNDERRFILTLAADL